jgi:hypothetical protein
VNAVTVHIACLAAGSSQWAVASGRLLALIKHQFHASTCRVNVWNNHVFKLSTNLVPSF